MTGDPATTTTAGQRLVLVAMIFAVSMMYIDATIVALALPEIQQDLSLSSTGSQWIINGYLLALAAMFLLGGRLADVVGHRTMVLTGIGGFAACSALCGATPDGAVAEAWIIVFRIAQGAFGALLFPAALAIVVAAFPRERRGKALAVFFGITGGITAVGPLAGGLLTEVTWRAIFWINVPLAILALILTVRARPAQERRAEPVDVQGAVLAAGAMGLVVLGLQQSAAWGWDDPRTIGSIVLGALLLVAFVAFELRRAQPLVEVRLFARRAFAADSAVLGLLSAVFVPFFFFASIYAQAALGQSPTEAGLFLLVFFAGWVAASQWGGRVVDRAGARPSVLIGCVVSAVGFLLWGVAVPDLDFNDQWYWIFLAGAGLGLVLGPVATDSINRAPDQPFGTVVAIGQTMRNLGASLGLAVMGSLFISMNVDRIADTLTAAGVPAAEADRIAHAATTSGGERNLGAHEAPALVAAVQRDIAHSTEIIAYIMAGVMVVAFATAVLWMARGRDG